ncbi:sodium-coupled monocarboxylate transporter 1 isoform X2 [Anastrepha obliqua]|uniref:sodium-coupled monocarboxylate transporter 1 isoform X2 n=1 Tax=Anastrepha obliqua TaxID=95512 RepID=UPI00240922A7|nr:sodium-coupled monocarboxylate transporter 1 isoform X2 [Anastrepha obliqua]
MDATESTLSTYDTKDDISTTVHPMNVAELSSSLQRFGIVDYFVFVLMLVVCAVIGFYFGFIEKKKKTGSEQCRASEALDYLVGGRNMKVLPVSLSLVASFVSGISLLGTSTEIYVYGTQYAFILFTLLISGIISWYVFLPVFCNLQLTSTYEYLEIRFDKSVRLLGSVLFSIGTIFWLPIVIYVPALAFNQVTGVNIHVVTPVVCVVCIFYTCVGGLKAVVWTDVLQTVVMVGSIILVIIKGTADVGGLAIVWQRNLEGRRIEVPEMTWDPAVRVSMLSILLGSTLYYTQNTAGNQVIMQRYLSLPGMKEVKGALIWFNIGIIVLTGACFYNGLLIYATYHDCDPLSTKLAKAKDQLVPLLVMDTLGVFPGMAGLFVAGVFSAALSSLSTGLNSLAAVILEDYIKPFRKTPLTERQIAFVMRLSVVLMGVLCVILVFVVERMGTVLQLTMTLASITSGPLLGLFIIGLMLPWINGKSALVGSIASTCVVTWICLRAQLAIAEGEIQYAEKPVATDGCKYIFDNSTMPTNTGPIEKGSKSTLQYIYHMTFMLYVAVGALLTVICAGLVTPFLGHNDPRKMKDELFSPFLRKFLRRAEYLKVQQPNEEIPINILKIKSSL